MSKETDEYNAEGSTIKTETEESEEKPAISSCPEDIKPSIEKRGEVDNVKDENAEEDSSEAAPVIPRRPSHAPQVDLTQLHCDPDFATLCSFFNKFAVLIGMKPVTFPKLEKMLTTFESSGEINKELLDMHLALMRRLRLSSVRADTFENYLKKFLASADGAQGELFHLERYGYVHLSVSQKVQILKSLCEAQFDLNTKLKDLITLSCHCVDLRLIPMGFDKNGLAYWYQQDLEYNIRVYTEEQYDQSGSTWQLIVRQADELETLIARLKSEDLGFVNKERPELEKEWKKGRELSAVQHVDDEGNALRVCTRSGTLIDICYDEQLIKKMKEQVLKRKEEKRNKRDGKKKYESEKEEDEEEEEKLPDEENDNWVSDRPRRHASQRAVTNIKKFATPTKRAPRKKVEKAASHSSDEAEENTEAKTSSGDSSGGRSDGSDEEESEESEGSDGEFKPKIPKKKSRKRKRRSKKKHLDLDDVDDEDSDEDEEEVKKERKKATNKSSCGQCKESGDWDVLLLCDVCDDAWHTYCLRPTLWYVPDGDWFCPKCVHGMLIEKLEQVFMALGGHLKSKQAEDKKKKAAADRLRREMEYIGVSLNNIIPNAMKEARAGSTSSSEEEEDVDEEDTRTRKSKRRAVRKIAPKFRHQSKFQREVQVTIAEGRSRRSTRKVDYNFSDYDHLIQSAVSETKESDGEAEGDIDRSCAGRGKDMANIFEAQRRSSGDDGADAADDDDVEKAGDNAEETEDGEKPQRMVGQSARTKPKPKRRKLNDLNAADDDTGSEFEVNESEIEEEEEPLSGSDYVPSDEQRRRRKRNTAGRLARTQSDDDFVVSGTDDDDSDYGGRKRKKKAPGRYREPPARKKGKWDSESETSESECNEYSDDSEAEKRRQKKGLRGKASTSKAKYVDMDDEDEEVVDEGEDDEEVERTNTGRPLRRAVAEVKNKKKVISDSDESSAVEESEDEGDKNDEEKGNGKSEKKKKEKPLSSDDDDDEEFKPEKVVDEEYDEEDEEEEDVRGNEAEVSRPQKKKKQKRKISDDEEEEGDDESDDENDVGIERRIVGRPPTKSVRSLKKRRIEESDDDEEEDEEEKEQEEEKEEEENNKKKVTEEKEVKVVPAIVKSEPISSAPKDNLKESTKNHSDGMTKEMKPNVVATVTEEKPALPHVEPKPIVKPTVVTELIKKEADPPVLTSSRSTEPSPGSHKESKPQIRESTPVVSSSLPPAGQSPQHPLPPPPPPHGAVSGPPGFYPPPPPGYYGAPPPNGYPHPYGQPPGAWPPGMPPRHPAAPSYPPQSHVHNPYGPPPPVRNPYGQ